MEACLSAHFVSRLLPALALEPRIAPAIYVKPFVKGQKNDYNDADVDADHHDVLNSIPGLHGCCSCLTLLALKG
jgi:transposase